MGKDLDQTTQDALEAMIDAHGLCAVLQSLSVICDEKADHIRSSYEGADLPKAWNAASGVIGVASTHKAVMRVGEP